MNCNWKFLNFNLKNTGINNKVKISVKERKSFLFAKLNLKSLDVD